MKNSKKKPTFKMPRAFLFTATCILLGFNFSYGQGIYVPAQKPQGVLLPYVTLENNAIYDYGSLLSPAITGQFRAVTTQSGTTCGIQIDDGYSNASLTLPAPTNTYNTAPDVIIGTDQLSTPFDPHKCLVAIAYTRVYTLTNSREIRLAVFEISGLGNSPLSGSFFGDFPISNINNEPNAEEPHIDIVAEYANLYPSAPPNLPLCDQFIITWGDNDPSTSGNCGVWAYYNKLSTIKYTIGTPTHIYPSAGTIISGQDFYPDVAAVQRKVNAGTGVGTIGEFTFVDYVNSTNHTLRYEEYDFLNPPSTTTSTVLDYNDMYNKPRIAGIDDIYYNDPSTMNMTPFYVVDAQNYGNPYNTIYGYYNIMGTAGKAWLSFPVGGDLEEFDLPSVTTGPDPSIYTVAFSDMLNSNLVAEKINWATGEPTSFPNNYYYQVNDTDTVGHPVNLNYQYRLHTPVNLAISASCNTNCYPNKGQLLVDWGDNAHVFEKKLGAPVVFRPAPTSVTNISSRILFNAAPNPVNDKLLLSGPVNNMSDGYNYSLADILGRTLQLQPISQSKQYIDVSGLPKGMYLLNIYKKGQSVQTMKVLKE